MKNIKLLLLTLLFCGFSYAQVGIGTTTPDPSSMLDVTSNSQGLLAPRMTTAERNAITDPATSLLVFDTTENKYYYNDGNKTTPNWIPLLTDNERRDNYKLVKSAADLASELTAGGGSKYLLQTNTLYEINGSITLAYLIELNDAQLLGRDAGEDKLSKASGGAVFTGSTGGNIKNLTITGGGTVFAITGGTSLLFQNCIVAGMGSVGTISGVGLYFSNIVNFVGNTTGITYTDIDNLLLNNQGWDSTNAGTYETFTGTFDLIEKVSGFSTITTGNPAIDVSSDPTVGTGVIQGTVFSGATTDPTGYVNRYTTQSAPFNFDNNWTVNAPGIPQESDDVASGNLFYNNSTVVNLTNSNPIKLPVTTDATRLFRIEATPASDNRITYKGFKDRSISIFAAISFTATNGTRLGFSIYKNGSIVNGTETIVDVLVTDARQSVSIIGTVDVDIDDYIEIYVRKISAPNEQFLVTSYNLLVN